MGAHNLTLCKGKLMIVTEIVIYIVIYAFHQTITIMRKYSYKSNLLSYFERRNKKNFKNLLKIRKRKQILKTSLRGRFAPIF